METKRVKVALFLNVKSATYQWETVWSARENGELREPEDYVRLSEWVDVDFPMLPDSVIADRKRKEVEATRARLQKQLAALGGGE